MADLVLGIAKPLVLGTLDRAQLAIEEESKFRSSTQRDLVFITGEFQMMQSFLSATTEENVKSEAVVSTWVTQVRDLAYDVEDDIEFVVHLDTKSDWLFRFIPRFMRKSLPLDEAVDIIEQMKARVRDVSLRNERYRLIITDSAGTSSAKAAAVTTNHPPQQPAAEAGDRDSAWKQRDMEALTKVISKEKGNELQVISVWTPNGDLAGAKSLIKKAYDNWKNWGKSDLKAWVTLPRPFNVAKFLKSLLDGMNASSPEVQHIQINGTHAVETEEMYLDQNKLFLELKRKVNKKPYLVVLEDLSTAEQEWNTIRDHLPDEKGARIIVSTKQLRTARICTGYPCFQRFSKDVSQCVFFQEGPLIGRTSEAEQIKNFLASARVDGLQVISVWGIPGAGKSALVRNLYREKLKLTNEKYKTNHIWVDVSNPFNLHDFCRSLLLQFHSDSLEEYEDNLREYNEDPVRACQGLLKDHQCLLVLDNLRSTKDWDLIHDSLAFRPSNSVIIVITNEERIALHCADRKNFVFNVKALEGEEAVNLFKRQVERNNWTGLLKELVSKCGGLPEVIVAIADYLAPAFNWSDRALKLNGQFIEDLEERHEFACLRDLFGCIHSYFRSCPDYLKPCIFYLSIFPQSQIIRRRRLVMRWVAEGYSKDKARDSAEETGEEQFRKITELSMIQPAERTVITNIRMVRCQINVFFQEYIKSRPIEENVTFALEVCILEGRCRQTTARTGRHIVIKKNWQRDKIVFERIDFSRLRSLTVFGEWQSYFISENMKVLRVLDLENASGVTNKDLKKMLKLLPRLKFLSLRNCKGISNLPCTVGDLRQLQILDLRGTSIVTIPGSITKLKKLQYLRAGTTVPQEDPSAAHTIVFKVSKSKVPGFRKPVADEVTSGVGKLTMLHTLGVVNVGSTGGKDILKEIKSLTQLRKLGVFGIHKKNIKEFYSTIRGHSHLQSLSVWYNGLDDLMTQETTKPPPELQSLKLYRLLNKLPVWMNEQNMDNQKLGNLRKLNLEINKLSEDDIKVVGLLKELCILRLRVTPPTDNEKLINFQLKSSAQVEEHSYKKIKILEIACASNSLEVTFGALAMQKLEVLKAGCFNGSDLHFNDMNHLTELKEVYVFGCHDDTLETHLRERLDGHPSNPRLENVSPLTVASSEGSATQESTRGSDQRYSFPFYTTATHSTM